jgi:hypothetical protein
LPVVASKDPSVENAAVCVSDEDAVILCDIVEQQLQNAHFGDHSALILFQIFMSPSRETVQIIGPPTPALQTVTNATDLLCGPWQTQTQLKPPFFSSLPAWTRLSELHLSHILNTSCS